MAKKVGGAFKNQLLLAQCVIPELITDYCDTHNLPLFIGCDADAHITQFGAVLTQMPMG